MLMGKVGEKVIKFLPVGFFSGLIGWVLLTEPTYDERALKKVALARGLSGVDELVASLGKSSASEISDKEADEMLLKAVGVHGFADHKREKFYSSQPKARCNRLFNNYIKAMNSTDPILADDAKSHRRDLVRYCGYKDDTGKK